jgi:adenine deaminase
MLCSDDLHPEMLMKRHINKLISGLIKEGFDRYDVLRSATINPVEHYNLEAGLLRQRDSADFIIVDDLSEMNVREAWIAGKKVFNNGRVLFPYEPGEAVNNFNCSILKTEDIRVKHLHRDLRVITAQDGELLTGELVWNGGGGENAETDVEKDILKIVVKDRYQDAKPSVAFIRGFGLKHGAFASSVAHDSHNIICIGTNDSDIVAAINLVAELKGGLAFCSSGVKESLALDIAGIMTTRACEEVAEDYLKLNRIVSDNGCIMKAPFMSLAFMALLVIPRLKIGDRGLFDVNTFGIVPLFM